MPDYNYREIYKLEKKKNNYKKLLNIIKDNLRIF